jgi:hypothetical protein
VHYLPQAKLAEACRRNGRLSLLTDQSSLMRGRGGLHRDFYSVPVAADRITIWRRSHGQHGEELGTEPPTAQQPHFIRPFGAPLEARYTLSLDLAGLAKISIIGCHARAALPGPAWLMLPSSRNRACRAGTLHKPSMIRIPRRPPDRRMSACVASWALARCDGFSAAGAERGTTENCSDFQSA